MSDVATVGGRDSVPAENLGVVGELRRGADAVRRYAPELHFPALVGEREQALAVGHEAGIADANLLVAERFDESPLLDRRDEELAARRENDAIAVRREMDAGDPFDGIPDPLLAGLLEVGDERDRDLAVVVRCDVIDMQISAELISDLTVA